MSRARRLGKIALGSAVACTGVGGYMYKKRLSQNKAVTAVESNAAQDQEKLQAGLAWLRQSAESRKAGGSVASGGPGLELFRFTTCPYCGKVKAFLDYYGIPHELVEVDPMFKTQLGESEYKKLPQLRFGGQGGPTVVDSELIVDSLAELVGDGAQVQDVEVARLRKWSVESLARHVTLNINTSLVEAWRGYAYIDEFDTIPFANKVFLKVVGAPVMYLVAKHKTLPTLIKAGEMKEGDDWRAVFHQQVDRYLSEANISETNHFHGGSRPDLADLDVYGVLQSVRGHSIYDDLLRNTRIGPWIARMDAVTGKPAYELATAS